MVFASFAFYSLIVETCRTAVRADDPHSGIPIVRSPGVAAGSSSIANSVRRTSSRGCRAEMLLRDGSDPPLGGPCQ